MYAELYQILEAGKNGIILSKKLHAILWFQ
jgi:hypothetical protein